MYEVKRNEKTVKGITFETWAAEITSANIVEIEVGTTGYQGGDTGHGGRTYFRFKDLASTDLFAEVKKDKFDNMEVIMELGGDTELRTFIESLEFAIKVLKEQEKY